MTLKPESDPAGIVKESSSDKRSIGVLEDLFLLGYTTSDSTIIFEDSAKNLKITAVFRTLTPPEIRDVFEEVGKYSTMSSQLITEQLETLARAIMTINGMPLTLSTKEKEEFKEKNGADPSPLEQARVIIIDKISSLNIIDALYDYYIEFKEEVQKNFEDLKKKLNPAKSSS